MTGSSRLGWFAATLRLALIGAALAAGPLLSGCAPLLLGGGATAAVAASEHRGLKGFASDTQIRASINHLWLQHSLDMTNRIGLTIDQGRVLLTGRAADAQMRLDAVRLAWQAEGGAGGYQRNPGRQGRRHRRRRPRHLDFDPAPHQTHLRR
ncbi:BON domain-containing protein [Azospirillum doebereinerae]|uniref:BON domain-containing protein n=1 Tax=Azospirillum doebereinerae TaxID=92933 RepID=UPI003850BC61